MGKARRKRIYFKKNGSLPPANNEKIVLTPKELENLITRGRIYQMEEDGFYRKQIKKRLNCSHTTITKWGKIGFDNPKALLEGIRTGRPDVAREIETVVLEKRTHITVLETMLEKRTHITAVLEKRTHITAVLEKRTHITHITVISLFLFLDLVTLFLLLTAH